MTAATARAQIVTGKAENRKRIVVIHGIVERNDAISGNVFDMAHALLEAGYEVTVFCHKNDYPNVPAVVVGSIVELIMHERYLSADLIVWHFGIYYELFNACMLGNGRAARVVCFHNITPKQFVLEKSWPTIERSLVQAHLMSCVDEVWTVSDLNALEARQFGVAADAIHTIPLLVDAPPPSYLGDKARERIEILFVGRFVKAKGVADLLAAIKALRERGMPPFRVTLAGNVNFSDAQYLQNLRAFVRERRLEDFVVFAGTVDDDTLHSLYRQAHILAIPSYHEGFCKPVVEGLRAGCIPVGYASYNLPFIANGFGRLVNPGDVAALTDALGVVMAALPGALQSPSAPTLPLDRGTTSVEAFTDLSAQYIQKFTQENVSKEIVSRLRKVFSWSGKGD